ncbi:MAG: hypothetical protein ACE5FD_11195 [Anaerolineae bacterium]
MSDEDNSLDFLDTFTDKSSTPKRKPGSRARRRGKAFSTGLEEVSPHAAAKATGSRSLAGKYKRYTVYLSPEDIERFKEIAGELNLSHAETARWFFQHMFDLFNQGLRPETEAVVIRRRLKRN